MYFQTLQQNHIDKVFTFVSNTFLVHYFSLLFIDH